MKKPNQLETILTHVSDFGCEIRLQTDKKNDLYINEKKVKYEKVVSLRIWELILVFLTTMGVLLQSVVTFLQYLK